MKSSDVNLKIKIGILCKDFRKLRNFELRIIEHIFNNPSLELSLLIFDERKKQDKLSNFIKFLNILKAKNFLSKTLLKAQEIIEQKIFKLKNPIEIGDIQKKLGTVDSIMLSPKRKGFLDIFSDEESDLISNYKLDIILRHEFNIIRGKILQSAKHGIWSFHHGDNDINRGGPSCFWEIILNQKYIGVTLQKLTPELDGGYIIDKGYYNKHWSWIKSRNIVQESSVNLLVKNFNLLINDKLRLEKSSIYYNKLYKHPKLLNSLKYITFFYIKLLALVVDKLKSKLFGIRKSCWGLFTLDGSFTESILFRAKPIFPPKNEFWADPFLINYKNNNYVFFENYSYESKKGKISCGILKTNNLIEIKDVLCKDYHLSYPFIFEEEGNYYMIPETSENQRLEIYICKSFPSEWELFSTAFEGEMILDCTYYIDKSNKKWFFLNKKTENSDSCSDLYIYSIDSLKLNHIEPHMLNPVITNCNVARCAGPIFEEAGKIFRPSQINNNGIYGRGINLNEIKELSLVKYDEDNVLKCYPNFIDNAKGMHHIHQTKDFFIADLCYNTI